MFLIDPTSYQDFQTMPEEELCYRNFYAEVLRRAIEDLRYYKISPNVDQWIRLGAYKDAYSAQAWLDDTVDSCAITFSEICEILGLDKTRIHEYIDRHELRFTPVIDGYWKARRQATKLRFSQITRAQPYIASKVKQDDVCQGEIGQPERS